MSKNIDEKDNLHEAPSAQAASIADEVQEPTEHLRISPEKVFASLSHLRIDRVRIKPIQSEAHRAGGNADVEPAILAPSSAESNDTEYVAVKKLRLDPDNHDDRAIAPLAHEVSLLNDLSHDNVVKIIGFVEEIDKGVAWMVFSWEKNGNLREFVRSAPWELPERLSLIHDIVEGLSYLHGRDPPISHGDLKSLNILVNPENRAMITDFGSAREMHSSTGAALMSVEAAKATEIQERTVGEGQKVEPLKAEIGESGKFITMTGPAWTLRWAAPELLQGNLPGLESDIWAFGWICWEAVTGNFPFEEENKIAVIHRIVKWDLPTLRHNAQLTHIKMLCSLMEDCLRMNANERPPAMRCQQVLSLMDLSIPSNKGGNGLATTRSSRLLHALGRIELGNGIAPKAEEYFRQSLEASDSAGDEEGRARALYAIGDVYRMQAKHSKAEESYIQSRDVYAKIGDQQGLARSTRALGDVYRLQAQYSKAEESYIQSRDLYSGVGDQLGVAQSVNRLGEVYRMRNEYSQAEESFIQSREIYSRLGDQKSFAQAGKALGDVYRARNEYSKAEEVYIQSRDVHHRIGDQHGLAYSVHALGDVYRMRNEHPKAEAFYIQSRDLYSEIGDQQGLAQSVEALGEVYYLRNNYAGAEESYIMSRKVYSTIGDQLGLANSLRSLGEVYRLRGENAKAEESFIQSRDLYTEIGDRLGLANSAKSLGDVYRMRGEHSKAEESYTQSRDLYSEIGAQLGAAQSVKALGDIYYMRSNYSRAEELYIQSRDQYSTIGDRLGLAQSVKALGDVQWRRKLITWSPSSDKY